MVELSEETKLSEAIQQEYFRLEQLSNEFGKKARDYNRQRNLPRFRHATKQEWAVGAKAHELFEKLPIDLQERLKSGALQSMILGLYGLNSALSSTETALGETGCLTRKNL